MVRRESVNKKKMVQYLVSRFNFPDEVAKNIVDSLVGFLGKELVAGKRIVLDGVFTVFFEPSERAKHGIRIKVRPAKGLLKDVSL